MPDRKVRVALLALVTAAAVIGGPAEVRGAQQLRVPIVVQETAGVRRTADPVTVGVPLPISAAIRDASVLGLEDADGLPVTVQARVLSRWNAPPEDERAPIRWVALHFQADVGASATARYTVAAADPVPSGTPLARVDGDGARVDTGLLAFRVGGESFRGLDDVRIDIDGDARPDFAVVAAGHGGGIVVRRPDGTLYRSVEDEPVQVTIEDNGPLLTVIRVDGRHHTGTANAVEMREGRPPLPWLDFTARIHAYRGKPWVRMTYSVRNPDRFYTGRHNEGGDRVFHELESLSLELPLRTLGDPLTLTLGGEAVAPWAPADATVPATAAPAWRAPLAAGAEAVVYQDSSGTAAWEDPDGVDRGTSFRGYIASLDREGLGRGHHAAGWGDVSALAWGMTAGIDDFWQNFPKGLRFAGDGVVALDLWPAQSRLAHRLAGGRQKTHDLFLDFHRQSGPDVAAFTSFASPLRAAVPPAWYRDTLAAGPVAVLPSQPSAETWRVRGVAEALLDPIDGLEAERRRYDLYGWRDYGDSYRAGDRASPAFGNNEFDFGWGLLMLYLTGAEQDPRYLDLVAPMIRHLADIDIYHTGEDAEAYSHGIRQHDGNGTVGHSRAPLLSHAWIRGLLTWYWVTGDRLALDAAVEVGGWIESLVDPASGELAWHGQSRSQAWAALALTELWEATGRAQYLDLAGRLLQREVLADQGGPDAPLPCAALDWEGDAGERERDDTSPWQNGYVAEALGRHAFARRVAGAPDRSIEEGLFRLLRDLERCGWATRENGLLVDGDADRDDEVDGRRYRSLVIDRIEADGSYTIAYPNNHLLSDGFTYGALFTSDPEQRRHWLEMAHETWRWTMGPESRPGDARSAPGYCCPATPAKNAGMSLRFGHVWRWVLQRMGSESTP